jgi:hypothetical protein
MAISFPSSPSSGTEFLADNGYLYFYDGSQWTTRPQTLTPDPMGANPFRYRTIFTRGYACNGYKNSSPWKNVNRMQHYTEVTTNLGDMFDYPSGYNSGGFSDYATYCYGDSNSVGGSSAYVSGFNHATETNRTHLASFNLTQSSRGDSAVFMNSTLSAAYITGGNSAATDKHNYATDTMTATGTGTSSPVGGVSCAWWGAYRGWASSGSAGAGYMPFATETWTSTGSLVTGDGHSKALSSKVGYSYVRPGSYASYNYLVKFDDTTGSVVNSSITDPNGIGGEENYNVGQENGYCIGLYDGRVGQVNTTLRVSYSADVITVLGATAQPKGHDGMSSGFCGSASSQLLGGL